MTPPRAAGRVLILILLLAAVLRVAALGKPLYIDEVTTLTVASSSLGEMAHTMRMLDASPALYPLLLHAWIQVSDADVWARLLPAIFGWLAVLVVWRVVRDAVGWKESLAAAFVMAIAPAHVHYAQYVRSYSLFTLLVAVHVGITLHWMRTETRPTRGEWLVLTGATAALLYTHYLSLLLFPIEALVVALSWSRARERVLAWGAAAALGAVLFVPGVPLLLHNIEHDRVRNLERVEPPPLRELVPTLVAELGVGQRVLGFSDPDTRRVVLVAAATVLPALALFGVVTQWRRRRDVVLLLALVVILPIAIYVGTGRKLVAVRFFVPFMIAYAALIGVGLANLRRVPAALITGVVVVMCAIPLTHFFFAYQWSYDRQVVADAIRARAVAGDTLVVVHPFEALSYRRYLDPSMPIRGLTFTPLLDQQEYVIKPAPLTLAVATERLTELVGSQQRFWIVGQSPRSFASDAAEERRVFQWLDERYVPLADLGDLTGGDPRVVLYGRRQAGGGVDRE
jgi:mannosyltransferase